MALYIPHSIFHLARLLYVRPETFGPTLLCMYGVCVCVCVCVNELYDLYCTPNITQLIKSRIMKGSACGTYGGREMCGYDCVGKTLQKKTIYRPSLRWEVDPTVGLEDVDCAGIWQDRDGR
jgi:hypothetical protein